MHNERMLHMDVKPQNIMISNNGRVVLIDFGGAHKYNISSQDNTTLARICSPGFTPPEPASSIRFSPAYDIYSLGATLYYILTGIIFENKSEDSQQEGRKSTQLLKFSWSNKISEETKKMHRDVFELLAKRPPSKHR